MQYHYVVGYDSEKDRWWVEFDPTAYFPDGSVWDDKAADETGYGWHQPDEGTFEEALDLKVLAYAKLSRPYLALPLVNGEL